MAIFPEAASVLSVVRTVFLVHSWMKESECNRGKSMGARVLSL